MKVFRNPVSSFSWQTTRKELAGIELPSIEVDPSMPAVDVAKLAERHSASIVTVRGSDDEIVGFFLPDYLAEVLPDHPLPASHGVTLQRDVGLAGMIESIDDAQLEFHSELVNLYPVLRRCPRGHLVKAAICPTHGVPTDDWL